MNRENQSQTTIDVEKPETKQPLKDDRSTSDQSRPEKSPRADSGQNADTGQNNEGALQPMAHPPEDTFVAEDANRRPGQKSG
jgi:hypothetical protein